MKMQLMQIFIKFDVNFNNGYNWFVYDNIFYVIDTDGMIKSQYDADKVADYGGGYTWLEEGRKCILG